MKIAKCRGCGKVVDRDVALASDWKLDNRFDESIYGFRGTCSACKNNGGKTPLRRMEDFIEYQKRFRTFNRHHYPALRKLLDEIKVQYVRRADIGGNGGTKEVFWKCKCGKVKVNYDYHPEFGKITPEGIWECNNCGDYYEWGT